MKLELARGNKKLPHSTAIFNLGSAKKCPSAKLGLCQMANTGVRCYALKAETQYPAVYPYRVRQLDYWIKAGPQRFAADFMRIVDKARKPITHLRVNESGDFRHQADVDNMEEVANDLADNGIITYCYTARSDLDFSGCDVLVVNGSAFKPDGGNEFKAVEKLPKRRLHCVGDCRKCDLCTKKHGRTVFAKWH